MSEIKPTEEHLNDPYVLQLIETLAKRDDEIERLQAEINKLKYYLDLQDMEIERLQGTER